MQAMLASRLALLVTLLAVAGCSAAPNFSPRPTKTLPDSRDAPHSESVFMARDGTSLYEQSWRPKGPARAAFVIVHGLKDHGDRYEELAEHLTARGFSVHAADLRGHGRSAGERVWVDHFEDYVDDLDDYLKLLAKRESPRRIVLFGHSMGGAIVTLHYLRKHPEVAGIVLSGPALKATVSGITIFGTRIIEALAPRAAVFQLDLHDFSRDPAVVEACENDPFVYQPAAAAHTALELLDAMDSIREDQGTFQVPMLLLHGAQDVVTDPDGTKALAERAGPNATLHVYDGLYHDLLHEPERATVMADIDAFLDRVAPPGN